MAQNTLTLTMFNHGKDNTVHKTLKLRQERQQQSAYMQDGANIMV